MWTILFIRPLFFRLVFGSKVALAPDVITFIDVAGYGVWSAECG